MHTPGHLRASLFALGLALGCAAPPSPTARLEAGPTAALDRVLSLLEGAPELRARLRRATRGAEGWRREGEGASSPGLRALRLAPRHALAARLGGSASDPLQLAPDNSHERSLTVRLEGAASRPFAMARGCALASSVLPATDLLVGAEEGSVEVLYVLRDEAAPRAWRWRVGLGSALVGARETREGAVEFVDRDARVQVRVPPGSAVDASGQRLAVRARWSEGEQTLRFELEGTPRAWPVAVDPVFEGLEWAQLGSPDLARWEHAMAYDRRRRRVVLFGGLANSVNLGETWEFDGTSWYSRNTPHAPAPRREHAMAYDTQRGVVVLFGGLLNQGTADDTWEYDGRDWRQRDPAVHPPALASHAMVWDGDRQRVVLFGGYMSFTETADLWEYDGTTWLQRATDPPPLSPEPRQGAALSYDSARHRAVLFGGLHAIHLGDTWEFDGARWEHRAPTQSPPTRAWAGVTYDEARARTVLHGGYYSTGGATFGDTWEYDGTTWTERISTAPTPSFRSTLAMVYDSARRCVVLFGGDFNGVALGDTWSLDDAGWHLELGPSGPSSSFSGAMAYDSARGRTVLLGNVGDTWEHDGSQWSRSLAEGPPAGGSAAMAYDSARGRTVLVHGGGEPAMQTWEYDGAAWTEQHTPQTPQRRVDHAIAYDSARGRTVLFGGTNGPPYGDTWEYDGVTWTERTPAGAPLARFSHAMAYDSARRRVVLFGGRRVDGLELGDTAEYDGTRWQTRAPLVSPPNRAEHALAYDSARGRTVLFGGTVNNGGGFLGDTWEYDGATWTQPSSARSPTPRAGHVMAFDVARGRTMLFGPRAETWVLRVWRVQGSDCEDNTQCATGHCADGVCCDTLCDGQCESCSQQGAVGACSPVTGSPQGGRPPCDTGASSCPAFCDGVDPEVCAAPSCPDAGAFDARESGPEPAPDAALHGYLAGAGTCACGAGPRGPERPWRALAALMALAAGLARRRRGLSQRGQ